MFVTVDIDPLSKSFRPLLLCTFVLALFNPLQYSKLYVWESLALSILTRLPCASEKVSSLAPAHINNAWCIFSVLNVYDWNIYWKQKCTKERYHLVLVSQYGTWAIKHFRIRIICQISKQIFKVENILKCKTHFTAGHLFESHSCKLLWSWKCFLIASQKYFADPVFVFGSCKMISWSLPASVCCQWYHPSSSLSGEQCQHNRESGGIFNDANISQINPPHCG